MHACYSFLVDVDEVNGAMAVPMRINVAPTWHTGLARGVEILRIDSLPWDRFLDTDAVIYRCKSRSV
jgi:hypothetical protein